MNSPALELRDIHLPEPISWWPIAPGWWVLAAVVVLLIIAMIIVRKIYRSKQLRRDITSELASIKQQYASTQSKVELARSLSILLRRASITYYPNHDVAGMTGDSWLHWLDKTHGKHSHNTDMKAGFDNDTGKILLTAPYLPDNSSIDYDAQALIELCESWLLASHKTGSHKPGSNKPVSKTHYGEVKAS